MSDRLLEVMAEMPNICRSIHLPAQSGATSMLERMNRKYTREWYLDRIAAIRRHLPDCAITTDLIAGFSGETEEEHRQTLSLMREVGYEFAYMFKYSERPGTFAEKHLPDDVPDEVKSRRLQEIIALQNELGHASNLRDVGREFEVLVEGESKRPTGTSFRAALRRTRWWCSTAGTTGSATMFASASRAARLRRFSGMSSPKSALKN